MYNNFITEINKIPYLPNIIKQNHSNSQTAITPSVATPEKNKIEDNRPFWMKKRFMALAATLSIAFCFTRSTSLNKHFAKLTEKCEEALIKITEKSQFADNTLTFGDNLLQRGIKAVNWGAKKAEGLTSLVPAKDILFDKLANFLHIKSLCNWTTKSFRNIMTKAHFRILNKNNAIIDDNFSKLLTLCTNPQHKRKLQRFQHNLYQTFGHHKTRERIATYSQDIAQLPEQVTTTLKKYLYTPWKHRVYVTDHFTATARGAQKANLQQIRFGITQNIDDTVKAVKQELSELKTHLAAEDIEARKICRKFLKKLEDFHKITGSNEIEARNKITNELSEILNHLTDYINSQKYNDDIKTLIIEQQNRIRTIYTSSKKGQLQEILTHIKNEYGKDSKEYIQAKLAINNISRACDKNIDSEMKLYQKYGELLLGSAPTDIVNLLAITGLGTYAVAKAEGKDGHVEASLKKGIPILGSVATLAYCTLNMVPNLASLAITAVVGSIFNKMGIKANDLYQDIRTKQQNTKNIIEEYNKIKAQQEQEISTSTIS